MRALLFTLSLTAAAAGVALAETPAAEALAERRALLAADDRCGLLSAGLRTSLEATTQQARNALLMAGRTRADVDQIDRTGAAYGRGHRCEDQIIQSAARRAKLGFEAWTRQHGAVFPGRHAAWSARRSPDPAGWFLWQDLLGGKGARFGYRRANGKSDLVLAIPDALAPPGLLSIAVRDAARAPTPQVDIPGVSAAKQALAMGAPTPTTSLRVSPKARERLGPWTLYVFDYALLSSIARLDPREAALIEIADQRSGRAVRLYLEAGDLVAAQAFLLAKAES